MKKNLVKIIIIASVVAISLGVYSLEKDEKPSVSDTTITSPVAPPATESTEIDISEKAIADWNTCRNEEYGYEFKYPSGWYVYETPIDAEEPYAIKTSSCQARLITLSQNLSIRGGFNPPTISAQILDYNWTGSVEEYLQTINTEFSPITGIKSDTINGLKTIQYVRQNQHQMLLLYKGNILNLSVNTRRNEKQSEFFNAIVSTFKFID